MRTKKHSGNRWVAVLAFLAVSCLLLSVAQASSDALLKKLVEKKVLTQAEADELRSELKKEDAQTYDNFDKVKVANWIKEMKWSGDLRLRYEYIDNEDQSNKNDRTRFRFRLRFGVETMLADWAKLGIRFATGGDDPVGTNQSLQDTFSRKPIAIDLAYATLTPPGTDVISVTAGKINNPIWQPSLNSPMQYDYDVTPEGIAEQVQWKFGDKKQHRVFANFQQVVLDEVGGDANDPYLLDFQGGGEAKIGPVKVAAAGGFSRTFNLQNMAVISANQPSTATVPSTVAQSSSANRGNATRQPGGAGTTLFYLDDFTVVYGRGELTWTICPKPFLGTPSVLLFSGEYIHNLSDQYDNLSGSDQIKSPGQVDGWTAQVGFGGAKKKGEWQVVYQYKYLEADSTWDAVSDSDFGLGGTDRKGHVIRAAYNLREWWQLGFGATVTEKISSRPNSGENTRGNAGSDLLRAQADTLFKF